MAIAARGRHTRVLKRRRIIERPRLFALLDESAARVRMLVAPAGYGKTTLAEQWVQRDGRRGAWYTARHSSTDVAALALGLARAASEIVPGADVRLREHLRAVPNPGEHVDVLAEILGEELAEWPAEGWLVVDDYQELVGATEAEHFIEELLAVCPLGLLIASRQRPTWATGRRILYGEVLELNQTMLAMDSQEAADVLDGKNATSASGLVALANGWPAVIGLAAVSSAEIEGENVVPETLYRFFAEEVFDSLGEDVRSGLATLAVAPVLDRELAAVLLGEQAGRLLQAALDVGILVERGVKLDIHPLARSFLEERSDQLGLVARSQAIEKSLDGYRARAEWDAAFELITRERATDELEPLLIDAVDDLLNTARLSTIETWCEQASKSGLKAAIFFVARAEVSLRYGRHAEAQTFAESAVRIESDLASRALSVGGRAAHLASREAEALELFRRAEAAAKTEVEMRDALWGQLACFVDLELPEATAALERLSEDVRVSDAREIVRAAAFRLGYQFRFGSLDLADADLAWELLDAVDDPLTESSFQTAYSASLALSARYDEARAVAVDLLRTARRYRLDFAVPYAHSSAAMASAGLREWPQAERELTQAVEAARFGRDLQAEQVVVALNLRVLAQQGRYEAALALQMPSLESSLPGTRAEVKCSRALVLASLGRVEAALAVVQEARGTTRSVEPLVLIAAVEAICALKNQAEEAIDYVANLERMSFSTGAVDLLVTAYRAAPELLPVLLRVSRQRELLIGLVRKARDEDLAEASGHAIFADDPRSRLSRRERDVYDLLCQGLTNRQIAELLFIEESTVKVHAHHIYDKLGTRSRTALAVQAALGRRDQATSATGESDTEAGS